MQSSTDRTSDMGPTTNLKYFQPCCISNLTVPATTAKPKSPNQKKKTITPVKAQSRQEKDRAQEWQKLTWWRTMLRKPEDFAHRKYRTGDMSASLEVR